MNKNKKFLDIRTDKQQQCVAEFRLAMKNQKPISTLFFKGKRMKNFFTEDSKLYITPNEQLLLRSGKELNRKIHGWDNMSSRVVTKFVRYNPSQASLLLKELERRYELFNDSTENVAKTFLGQFSTVRLWNASIIGSILFGMVMMTFVYKYLGQGAAAKQPNSLEVPTEQVSTAPIALNVANTGSDAQSFAEEVQKLEQIRSTESLNKEISEMVKGYPIEKMVPYIAEQDRTVAAFIVAIARKESGWGEHVPVLSGKDCYNYWGYRGIRDKMGTGGHTCFDSPKDAVDTVAKRIATLVEENGKDTPQKMVIWKCGSSCAATGGQAAANKWVDDVNGIFEKFNKKE